MKHTGRGLLLAAFLICAQLSATVIDCGSPAGDQYVSGGSSWLIPQALLPPGSTDATLRFGASFSYHVPVAPGAYSVTLRFQEPALPGELRMGPLPRRVFNVSINGALVMDQFDLFAVAGLLLYSRVFDVSAPGGFIDVLLVATIRSAVISAIEVAAVAPMPPQSTELKAGDGVLIIDIPGDRATRTFAVNPATVGFLGAPNLWTNNNDFGHAVHTTPAKVGKLADAPRECAIGEQYFAVDVQPGFNLYGCTAPGVWTGQR